MKKKVTIILLFTISSIHVWAQHTKIGLAKDKHGCNAAAGYVWSNLKGICIRPFDQPIKLHEVNSSKTFTTNVPVILNANKSKAEVILADGSIILNRQNGKNVYLLTSGRNQYKLVMSKTISLYKNGALIYANS